MLSWFVKVFCKGRGDHITLDVLNLSRPAGMLRCCSVGLQWGYSASQWACRGAALDPSESAVGPVAPPGDLSVAEAWFLDVFACTRRVCTQKL